MKTKNILFLIFCSSLNYLAAQKQFALEMPEYNTLYEGYQNKVFVASKNGKVVNPKCQTAEIKEDKYNGRACLTINPKVQGDILVYFDVVNVKGKKIGSDSVLFFVRPFPKPAVLSTEISKSRGGRLSIGLSPGYSISSINFKVLSMELQTGSKVMSVDGSDIPASILSSIEEGELIRVRVTYGNSANDKLSEVEGALKITN
jgi:hypothetical protein